MSYYMYYKEGSMRDKLLDYTIDNIKLRYNVSDIKAEEIKYGLYGLYTIITKSTVICIIAFVLSFFKEFIIFLIFYALLRSVGFGAHAKTNFQCWFFSTILLIGIPYFLSKITINFSVKIVIWSFCFLNFLIFSPADTEKRPIISKKRKLVFKIVISNLSLLYLALLIKFNSFSNLILASMILEGILVNPIGYVLMRQKVRFKLNDINLFKQR